MDTLTLNDPIVNSPDSVYFIVDADTDLSQLIDGVYPYDDPCDQWVVVIDCQPIGWAPDWSAAAMQEIEALRVKREHITRNPANGLGKWWTIRTADYVAGVDRKTGEVSYNDC